MADKEKLSFVLSQRYHKTGQHTTPERCRKTKAAG